MTKYHHQAIEKKWQKYWLTNKTFAAKVDQNKEKFYVLDMFPYPSGAGLHVGHVTGYTATDVVARYKRQKGLNVLHPMGWDSFGLPAEQYAVRTGTHPADTTKRNIDTYRRQLQSLGFSYDWDREIATTDETYFKWTQWIFTKLYEEGLAYEAEALVNYCPELRTVLANEEVENGLSKEGGFPVERRPLRQWVLKITAYAEKLLQDLDDLDWPDYLKRLQRQWIGKSEGAKVRFAVKGSEKQVEVFTTRHDTIYGATFLVLSPEHPLVDELCTNQEEVAKYRSEVAAKSDLERTDLNKDKSGVPIGAYGINPISGEKVPIWIADYVLMGYGTGAVMGVPSDDARDREFVTKYNLPIIEVIEEGRLINSEELNGLSIDEAKLRVVARLEEIGSGEGFVNYKLRDWLFSRQRYWGEPIPILHYEDGTRRSLDLDELPLTLPEVADFRPCDDGKSPLAKVKDWVEVTDPKTGKKAMREVNAMPQWAGSCWYYLRFCDPKNNDEAWNREIEKYWMPVDLYVGGVEHAVLHLLYARFWHKVLFDLGMVSTKEPFQCLRNQGLVTSTSYKIPGGKYLSFEDVEQSGKNYVESQTGKPVDKMIEKMSKSKLNGVSPDEIIEEYGADTLRLYEMFMAPFEKEKLWNHEAINGCYRFLNRFHDLVYSDKVTATEEGMKLAHILVDGVERDINNHQFNTAISKMMEFLNGMIKLKQYPKEGLKMAVQALAPFAPHFAEECWEYLTGETGISFVPFPTVDPKMLVTESVTYVAQVNGKVRARWELPLGIGKDELLEKAKGDSHLSAFLKGDIVKVIFVPNKLLNIVVK
jgi:leucyl-tRNA synthetase